jgi:hypothetical protein
MRRLRIAGLKIKHPMALLDWAIGVGAPLTAWTEAMASAGINLRLVLVWPLGGGNSRCLICLKKEATEKAVQLAGQVALDHSLPPPRVTEPVAAITIYPIGSDPALPLVALGLLHSAGRRPLAVGTSLSAAVLVVPDDQHQQCLEILSRRFELPTTVSPPESRLEIIQSPHKRDSD